MFSVVQIHETVHSEASNVVGAPAYRVNFWERSSPQHAWNLDAYVLTEALDIQEVLRWADDTAHGRRFEAFVETDVEPIGHLDRPRTSALVRVFGDDPNVGDTDRDPTFLSS